MRRFVSVPNEKVRLGNIGGLVFLFCHGDAPPRVVTIPILLLILHHESIGWEETHCFLDCYAVASALINTLSHLRFKRRRNNNERRATENQVLIPLLGFKFHFVSMVMSYLLLIMVLTVFASVD